jgi:hypothetical protein
MEIQRLLRLAKRLDNIPARSRKANHEHPHFDMSDWMREGDCGTAACAVGHACLLKEFNKQGLRIEKADDGHWTPVFDGVKSWFAVTTFFGLKQGHASRLFSAECYTKPTPKLVAARIRELVAEQTSVQTS